MNERIKQLAEKSLQTINNISSKGITDQRAFNQVWFEHYNQKFAELIVRECANVAANHDALDIYEEIREHFGVEE